MIKKHALVVGGAEGIGLALACQLVRSDEYEVSIAGGANPGISQLNFCPINLGFVASLRSIIEGILFRLRQQGKTVDLLVYAVGGPLESRLAEWTGEEIFSYAAREWIAPMHFLRTILSEQEALPGFIAVPHVSEYWSWPGALSADSVATPLGDVIRRAVGSGQVQKTLIALAEGIYNTSSSASVAFAAHEIFRQYQAIARKKGEVSSQPISRCIYIEKSGMPKIRVGKKG